MGEPEMTLAKRALSGALALVLVCVVALAAFSVVGPAFGWHVNVVLSGSMEPAVHTGDVIITRPVAPGQVAVGEIILFRPARGESFVAHRVVAVTRDPDLQFVTKGDANNGSDPSPVLPAQLAGVLFLEIPYLYYVFLLIRTPPGLAVTICIPALVLIAFEVRKRWHGGDEV